MAVHFGSFREAARIDAVKPRTSLHRAPAQSLFGDQPPQLQALRQDTFSLRFGNAAQPPQYKRGLEGAIMDYTKLSDVDPAAATLIYRGYDISDLVQNSSFEETSYLLLNGKLPSKDELKAFNDELVKSRSVPLAVYGAIRKMPKNAHPMDKLEAAVATLKMHEDPALLNDNSHDANVKKAIHLIGAMPTLIAIIYSYQKGNGAMPPSPSKNLSHAENFLYMLTGKKPDPYVAKVFDKTLIAYADHGFNASTTAARVTASTQSDMYSAIVSAIGTLKGPLHGGANEQVMRMLQAIDQAPGKDAREKAEAYVKAQLDAGKTVMGFGHREYKKGDPRAAILMPEAEEVGKRLNQQHWPELAKTVKAVVDEQMTARKGKTFPPNVDFPIGYLYHMLGLPMELFTPVFALARVTGWASHVVELQDDNRLYRPKADYQGARGKSYLEIDKR